MTRRSAMPCAGRLWALVLFSLPAWMSSPAWAQDQQLIEGFENLSAVTAINGKLSPVTGEGATEGKQAAQLPPGAAIKLQIKSADSKKFAWLKVDTLTVQPLPANVMLKFYAPHLWMPRWACVQVGKDTLAVPMTAIVSENPPGWNEENISLEIVNSGDAGLILDNVRFEAAAKPPADCILTDFGWDGQGIWPGFTHASANNPFVMWSGQNQIFAGGAMMFDPLIGGIVGSWGGRPDFFDLTVPGNAGMTGWLWVTHLHPSYSPVLDYSLKFKGKTLMAKRLNRTQVLGGDGLMEGIEGLWTPEWFNATYVPHFCESVPVSLAAGKNRFDATGCQLAAMAIGPQASQQALSAYIDQVQKDLARYRRQFVLGYRLDAVCMVAPNDAEQKSGLMTFSVPADKAFLAGYQPAEGERAAILKAQGFNGGQVILPVACVPVKKVASGIAATVSPLKNADGRVVTGEVHFLQRVPRIVLAHVEFQPWILAARSGPANANEIMHAAVVLSIPQTAPAGVYRGVVKFYVAGNQVEQPVELEVFDLGPEPVSKGGFGGLMLSTAAEFYRSYADTMTDAQRDETTKKTRQQLLSLGLQSMMVRGPVMKGPGSVKNDELVKCLKWTPVSQVTSPTIVDVESLVRWGPDEDRVRFLEAAAASAAKMTADLCGQAHLPGQYMHMGWVNMPEELAALSKDAAKFTAAGGSPCVITHASTVTNLKPEEFKTSLTPFKAILLNPNVGKLNPTIAAFKALGPDRQVFIWQHGIDRYAAGFFAAASGADGTYIRALAMDACPYNGFQTSTAGLLVAQSDGGLATVLPAVMLWQAKDDYALFTRAAAILEKARQAKANTAELEKALDAVRNLVGRQGANDYNPVVLRTGAAAPAQMEGWRAAILKAAGSLQPATKGVK